MGSTPPRELITINHACERVRVSRRTIYNWIAAGKLETKRTKGGALRIYADTLWATSIALKPGDGNPQP